MNAKERAEYLLEKFFFWDTSQGERDAKKSVLVFIDEMQEYITKYDNHVPDFKYWEEVRKELNKIV